MWRRFRGQAVCISWLLGQMVCGAQLAERAIIERSSRYRSRCCRRFISLRCMSDYIYDALPDPLPAQWCAVQVAQRGARVPAPVVQSLIGHRSTGWRGGAAGE